MESHVFQAPYSLEAFQLTLRELCVDLHVALESTLGFLRQILSFVFNDGSGNTPPSIAYVTYPVAQSTLELYMFCFFVPLDRSFAAESKPVFCRKLWVVHSFRRDGLASFRSEVELSHSAGSQNGIGEMFATLLTLLALLEDQFLLRIGKALTRHFGHE